ncbi:hypothetical protein NM208_g8425 [Fusarium decemcellulare]|uniref:Uncharacterized protein n=1 Tax=Fusarium decemcellulare TaxID=57161 RepID=A0ACC1S5F7_9HYPO|nr:hypothetical protein NM208_g8425 [Fusarium decemcellulare]
MPPTSSLCSTPACIRIAEDIIGNLALNYTEIDPCTDFDQYVCGNFDSRHDIPAGAKQIDTIGVTGANVASANRRILEGLYPSGEDAGWITVNLTQEQTKADMENFEKMQETYQACMNYTVQEEEGLDTLKAFVKSIVHLFPATQKSDNNTEHLSTAFGKTLALFESLGIETTQRILFSQNVYDPDELVLIFSAPTNEDLPTTKENAVEYGELGAALLAAVHPANLTKERATSLMESVVKLEFKMRETLLLAQKNESNTAGASVPLELVQKHAPLLNYEYVIKQLAPKDYKAENVTMSFPGYYANLSEILSETPAEVIQSFFVWKAISALSTYVETDLTNAYNNFLKRQEGYDTESLAPRWQRCVSFVNNGAEWTQVNPTKAEGLIGPSGLTWILSRFFVDKYFPPEAKELTSQLVKSLEAAFLERIETRDWATDKVKKAAAEKARAMGNKIGLPTEPDVVDPIAIKEYYDGVEISPILAVNALALAKLHVAKRWAALGKPFNREQFKFSTLTVNAYQDRQLNEMVLLAGFQQFPLYDVGFPSYLLYGGMGSVVGHEITHGFDNVGRLVDQTGKVATWWDEESIAAFENNGQRDKGPRRRNFTLAENIADAGGVVSSYEAWKKWESENGKAKNLPGLEKFTNDQLFFVKWGQGWCGNIKPEEKVKYLSEDPHSPNEARILLPLKNSAAFNKAFNCPQKKPVCELW